MNKIVDGCSNCPFAAFGASSIKWQCFHPEGNDFIGNFDDELITPDWCPLKKQSITIAISETNCSNKREDVLIRSILFERGNYAALGMKRYAKLIAQEFSAWVQKNNWVIGDEKYYNGVEHKTGAQLYRQFDDECLQRLIV